MRRLVRGSVLWGTLGGLILVLVLVPAVWIALAVLAFR